MYQSHFPSLSRQLLGTLVNAHSDLVYLVWSVGACISNKLSDDADTAMFSTLGTQGSSGDFTGVKVSLLKNSNITVLVFYCCHNQLPKI